MVMAEKHTVLPFRIQQVLKIRHNTHIVLQRINDVFIIIIKYLLVVIR